MRQGLRQPQKARAVVKNPFGLLCLRFIVCLFLLSQVSARALLHSSQRNPTDEIFLEDQEDQQHR